MTPVCPSLVVAAMLFLSAGLNRWRQIIQLGYLQPFHTQRPLHHSDLEWAVFALLAKSRPHTPLSKIRTLGVSHGTI